MKIELEVGEIWSRLSPLGAGLDACWCMRTTYIPSISLRDWDH